MMRTIYIAIAAAILTHAGTTCGADQAVLVDENLQPQLVAIQSLRAGRISYFDQQRSYHRLPIDRFLQWRSNQTPAHQVQRYPMIHLVDGQRLRGQWIGADADGDAILWQHPLLGLTSISLDQVSGYYAPGGSGEPGGPQSSGAAAVDTITLTNGDLLMGIILSTKESGVLFEPDGQDHPLLLDIKKIQCLTLVTSDPFPGSPGPPGFGGGHMIYFHDGSRILTQTLAIEQDRLLLEDDAPASISLSKVARIDFASGRRRLVGLSTLSMAVVSGGEVFGMKMLPRSRGADVLLHAPIQLQYQLPDGAIRFAVGAEIDANDHSASIWTDFNLVLSVDGKEVSRHHLTQDQRQIDINIECRGAVLTLGLESAGNGPIMDRLRLRDPVVLLTEKDAR